MYFKKNISKNDNFFETKRISYRGFGIDENSDTIYTEYQSNVRYNSSIYSRHGEQPQVALPLVEYTVRGKQYRKRLEYKHFIPVSSGKIQKDIFSSDYVYGSDRSLDLKKIFPVGSGMTVYYNPKNPEEAYVERCISNEKYFKYLFIGLSIFFLILIGINLFRIFL
ncbi:DUF3592 domain-containing protein [Streptococcus sanguinis]|uniref:DUF3592 domain-containing protein n=1 Tax=Streptococcus sanguinis TaxID=1305 RepID=UPI0028964050|nr:DUF3592 domain-containing protein [Streptococcus sanguinis]